jgi:hypothetical protein
MSSVELYSRVRRACHVDGMSNSAAARLFGIDRKTVAKILKHSVPSGYRREGPPTRPKRALGWRSPIRFQIAWKRLIDGATFLRSDGC